jgi:putative ABC transport system permease protein
MALFIMILRKMAKNRWLELCLLTGLVVSVALSSSMPIYTHAILQRLLVKDLENLQLRTQKFPGAVNSFTYSGNIEDPADNTKRLLQADAYLEEQSKQFGLPVLLFSKARSTSSYTIVPSGPAAADPNVKRNAEIAASSHLEEHVRLVDGRMPAKQQVNGVYEAMVTEQVLTELKLVLGNEFTIEDKALKEPVRIKPVAVIDRKDYSDVYWYNPISIYKSSFLIDYDLFEQDIVKGNKLNTASNTWFYALDYSQMKLETIPVFTATAGAIKDYIENNIGSNWSNPVDAPALQTLAAYYDKEKKLKLMLWSLHVPVMILLAFYLFMVANLITERQKTEIAVLRSRGASRLQILMGYLLEGVLLGLIALALGPLLGLQLTRILGASNGFLEFVQRASVDVKLNREAYKYAWVAVGASVFMILIPVFHATRVSIVGHKQAMARQQRMTFLHKSFIDVILLGISLYLLQSFHRRMNDLVALGLDSTDLKIDPLLFVVPALFMLSMGLLIMRVYPILIQLVYRLGRRWWPPYLYSTLLQVGRSANQYQFIMLFLSLTLATGIFSASAARTMNQNISDKIQYKTGADIVLQNSWENDAPPPDMGMGGGPPEESTALPQPKKKVQYKEPPFLPFAQLPGVESTARVFTKPDAVISFGKEGTAVQLMGIDTDDFGRTAWLREGLLDHHFNEYLNLLASNPKAVLISKSVSEKLGAKIGDVVQVGWRDAHSAQFHVYGIIDYWPSWNPNPVSFSKATSTPTDKKAKAAYPMLVIGHLPYIQNNIALEPYEVWLKLQPHASIQTLYDAMEQKNLKITKLTDRKLELINSQNDPFQLAINGVMTLGFLIGMLISFIGFLIYWTLSLSGRILQFGVLRAMGISFKQIIGMLITEQLLTSGAAVMIGVLCGQVTSNLFVPFFQLSFDPSTQVPPFQVTFDPSDRIKLYVIVSLMILVGLMILGTMLSRIKIHQAVKLGED